MPGISCIIHTRGVLIVLPGIGADIVITDMNDLATLVGFFAAERAAGNSKPFTFPEALLASLSSKYYLKA